MNKVREVLERIRTWTQRFLPRPKLVVQPMSKRDYFAAQAMTGLLMAAQNQGYLRDPSALAIESYRIADAMWAKGETL